MPIAQYARFSAVVVLTLALSLVAVSRADAQMRIGGGLNYATLDGADLGFQVNAYFGLPQVVPGLRAGGDITYYLPQNLGFFGAGADFNVIAFNANAQYVFLTQEEVSAYGLAGLSLSRWAWNLDNITGVPGTFARSGTELGLNLGAGAEYIVGFGSLYGEAKVVTGDMDRFVISAGVRIPVGQ